jgi:hypothetical protein
MRVIIFSHSRWMRIFMHYAGCGSRSVAAMEKGKFPTIPGFNFENLCGFA